MERHVGDITAAQTPTSFCDLNAICGSAARIGCELAELPCDEQSPAVSEGIVVRLECASDGRCPRCGMRLHKAGNIGDASICPKCAWQYSGDKSGSRALVPITDEDVPDFEFE